MSDAIARPTLPGKSVVSLLLIAAVAVAAATPADALRIRIRPRLVFKAPQSDQKPEASLSAPEPLMAAPLDPSATPPGENQPGEGLADDERSKKVLAEERRGVNKLHPLQTSEPTYNIVVCEAGCGDAKPHVVFKRPVAAVRSASAEAATPAGPAAKIVECRGGCDGGNAARAASITGPAPGILNGTAGSWMTTAEPGQPNAAAKPATPDVKQQASKASREDWMARINRERAAASKEQQEITSQPDFVVKEPSLVPDGNPVKDGNPIKEDH